ncbi:beta-ketoacyl-[acyl-carrier-protein] synthase family protein [Spirochaeta dissipatitropha]
MGSRRRVVISGIGPVSSLGSGRKDFQDNILAMGLRPKPIPADYEDRYHFQSRFKVPLPESGFDSCGFPPAIGKIMDGYSRLAVEAAVLAVLDAGLELEAGEQYLHAKTLGDCGVLLGCGVSNLEAAFTAYRAHHPELIDSTLSDVPVSKASRFPLMTAMNVMANSPAAWISILLELGGECSSLNTACASGTCAIGEAFRKIRDGYADTFLAGGAEYFPDEDGGIMRSFDVLGTLTRAKDGNPRPFCTDRSGFLFTGGGACMLLLEELEHARRRGADIYCEITDYQSNSDAWNIVKIGRNGDRIRELYRRLLQARNAPPDYINAHGTGTELNDSLEAEIIRDVFGSADKQPLINSTKGLLGHTIAASGAFEAAVTAISIHEGIVHGNHISEALPDLNLSPESRELNIRSAFSFSYGFGGHNAGLGFSSLEDR